MFATSTRAAAVGLLFDKTEIRGERLDLLRRQPAGNIGHRWPGGGMIALAPLLKPPFQIGVLQATQAGNLRDALRIRAMADHAGDDIVVGHALLIDRSAESHAFS